MAKIEVMNLMISESVTAVELRYRRGWRCDWDASNSAPKLTPRYAQKSAAATPALPPAIDTEVFCVTHIRQVNNLKLQIGTHIHIHTYLANSLFGAEGAAAVAR